MNDINLRPTLSLPKSWNFEPTLIIPEVEKFILTSDKDEEGVLATMEEGPKRRSRTSPTSLVGL